MSIDVEMHSFDNVMIQKTGIKPGIVDYMSFVARRSPLQVLCSAVELYTEISSGIVPCRTLVGPSTVYVCSPAMG